MEDGGDRTRSAEFWAGSSSLGAQTGFARFDFFGNVKPLMQNAKMIGHAEAEGNKVNLELHTRSQGWTRSVKPSQTYFMLKNLDWAGRWAKGDSGFAFCDFRLGRLRVAWGIGGV